MYAAGRGWLAGAFRDFCPTYRPKPASGALPPPRMTSPPDALRAKTDPELQFFVNNPSFYHADMVAAARRELARRGSAAGAPAPLPTAEPTYAAPAEDPDEAAPPPGRSPLLWVGLLALLLAAGAWWWQRTPPTPVAGPRPAALSPDSLKLTEVVAHPLPTFDIDGLVATQVARMPAAEQRPAAALRQFRELCRRFWAAETQSEFLVSQARAGKANEFFADQALAVRSTWRDWNKAVVYHYDLGPKMQDQVQRMAQVASNQQHVLDRLPGLLPGRQFLGDEELKGRQAEVEDIMRGITPISPVTGRPYRAIVLRAH